MKRSLLMLFAASALAGGQVYASGFEEAESAINADMASAIEIPAIIEAIEAQNLAHAALTESDILQLDQSWRAETSASSRPTIDTMLENTVSQALDALKATRPDLYSEIFVTDNKGLNVGMSDMTSDYWQGDEAKFTQTFGSATGSFTDEVEFDESTQVFSTQISRAIRNSAGEHIGIVTFGVIAE